MATADKPVTDRQYRAMADFRYELRRFLRYSEEAARQYGMTPLQYQMLLQIRGFPVGTPTTIGAIAERLQAKHHGVVALVTRCEKAGFVARRSARKDRRAVLVVLTRKGAKALEQLARLHRNELLAIRGRLSIPGLQVKE